MHRVNCPYCKDSIASRGDGVRCAECGTPHHASCWSEGPGTCTVLGCESTQHRPFTRRAATRIVIGAGKAALGHAVTEARVKLGGKSVVALFLVTLLVVGLPLGVVLYRFHPAPVVQLEIVLGGLLGLLWIWLSALLYRGDGLENDLDLQVARKHLTDYYKRMWSGLTGEGPSGSRRGGCGDGCSAIGDGCGTVDGEGALLLLAVIVVVGVLLLVLPLLAWLAIELIGPLLILAVYGVLYGALAVAVNGNGELKGRLGACVWTGLIHALAYTVLVGCVLGVGLYVHDQLKPPPTAIIEYEGR